MVVLVNASLAERAQALVDGVCVTKKASAEGTPEKGVESFLLNLLYMRWKCLRGMCVDYHAILFNIVLVLNCFVSLSNHIGIIVI